METPTIASALYGSSTSALDMGALMDVATANEGARRFVAQAFANQFPPAAAPAPAQLQQPKKETATVTTRLVQVFIADPDENVPLADRLLYSGEQKLTDLTDQELFFEVDIKKILDAHNEKRAKLINKKIKERTEYLEPARIRDLKMVVVNVAGF